MYFLMLPTLFYTVTVPKKDKWIFLQIRSCDEEHRKSNFRSTNISNPKFENYVLRYVKFYLILDVFGPTIDTGNQITLTTCNADLLKYIISEIKLKCAELSVKICKVICFNLTNLNCRGWEIYDEYDWRHHIPSNK